MIVLETVYVFLYLEIKAKKEITRPLRKCTNILMKHPEP